MRKYFIAILAALLIPALCFAGTSTMPALTTETNLLGTHYFWVTDAAGTVDKKASISQIFGTDPELSTIAAGLSGPVFGLGAGSGYRAATFADIVGLWTTCTAGALQYDGSCAAGGGSVDVSGTPANHYFAVWTDADTIKGVNVGASKVVCTDANGDPVACTGITSTELTVESVLLESSDADPTEAAEIKHDNSDANASGGGSLKWYDGTNSRTLIDTGTTHTILTREEFIPIRYLENGTVAPEPATQIGTTGLIARAFSEGDSGIIWWHVPADFKSGLKFKVVYGLSADAAATNAVFSMTGCNIANSEAIACTAGTELKVTDALTTDEDATDLIISDYSAASEGDWGLTAGNLAKLVFSYHADSTYGGEPKVVGVWVKYNYRMIDTTAGY